MKNKTTYIIGGIIILIIVLFSVFRNIGVKQPSTPMETNNQSATQNTTTNPQDIVPGTYKNEIKNISTTNGLSILSGLVENNVDSNNKVVDDHLELVLQNISQKDMSNFEAYYTVKDLTTGKSEGYYKKLEGFVLKIGETQTIHFDNKTGTNHFGINKDGIYFTSKNKLQFDVQISTPEFKIATLQIIKDAGGAETKD